MRAGDNKLRLGATQLTLELTNQPAFRLARLKCRAILLALTQVGVSITGRALVGIAVASHVVEEPLRVGAGRCCKRQARSKSQGRHCGA
jgi:hypothetical protein